MQPLQGHTDDMKAVAISTDGKRIVSGSDDNTICVWKAGVNSISNASLSHSDYLILAASSRHPIPMHSCTMYQHLVSGWVMTEYSELLFWLPPNNRKHLTLDPHLVLTIGHVSTHIDLSQFVCGPSWSQCC